MPVYQKAGKIISWLDYPMIGVGVGVTVGVALGPMVGVKIGPIVGVVSGAMVLAGAAAGLI